MKAAVQVTGRPGTQRKELREPSRLQASLRKSNFLSHHASLRCVLSTSGFCVLIPPGGNWVDGRLQVFPVSLGGLSSGSEAHLLPEVASCTGAASSQELCGGSRRVNLVALGRIIPTRETNGCPSI